MGAVRVIKSAREAILNPNSGGDEAGSDDQAAILSELALVLLMSRLTPPNPPLLCFLTITRLTVFLTKCSRLTGPCGRITGWWLTG